MNTMNNNSFEDIGEKVEEMVSIVEKLGSLLKGILKAKKEEVPSVSMEILEEREEVKQESLTESPVKIETVESNGQAKASKSDLVRKFLHKHGTEVRNKDVVEAIKKETGVEVTASLVSILKSKQVDKKGRTTKGKESKVWTSRVTSGSALIRDYLEQHGIDSTNEEVVKHVKNTKGVDIRPTLVSSVRAIMKKKGAKTTKVNAPLRRKVKTGRGPTMPSLIIEILKKAEKGLELSGVTKKVLKSDYEYKGSKDIHGISQNVYQALHNLSRKITHPGFRGKVPVVIHEKIPGQRGRLYKLNPKAKVA